MSLNALMKLVRRGTARPRLDKTAVDPNGKTPVPHMFFTFPVFHFDTSPLNSSVILN